MNEKGVGLHWVRAFLMWGNEGTSGAKGAANRRLLAVENSLYNTGDLLDASSIALKSLSAMNA